MKEANKVPNKLNVKKKKLLLRILLWFSKKYIKKYKPKVISITGSVGKTTTSNFIYKVLRSQYNTRKTGSNWNFRGVPAAVLNIAIIGSFKYFFKELPKIIRGYIFIEKNYPEILVLERGIASIGQMDRFNKFIKSNVGVVTSVFPTHIKKLKTIENVAQEKRKLVENLTSEDYAVLNYDSDYVKRMAQSTQAKTISYGLQDEADIRAENIKVSLNGINFDLIYKDKKYNINVAKLYNKYHIYSILAAIACGLIFRIKIEDIIKEIEKLKTVKGRGNIVKQENGAYIINDAYNSSPKSCIASLDNLKELGKERHRIAVLGDMLELGDYTRESHIKVARQAVKVADVIICVGENAKYIYDEAKKLGFLEENLYWVSDSDKAKTLLDKNIKPESLVLLKASHGIHLDKILAE